LTAVADSYYMVIIMLYYAELGLVWKIVIFFIAFSLR